MRRAEDSPPYQNNAPAVFQPFARLALKAEQMSQLLADIAWDEPVLLQLPQ